MSGNPTSVNSLILFKYGAHVSLLSVVLATALDGNRFCKTQTMFVMEITEARFSVRSHRGLAHELMPNVLIRRKNKSLIFFPVFITSTLLQF